MLSNKVSYLKYGKPNPLQNTIALQKINGPSNDYIT